MVAYTKKAAHRATIKSVQEKVIGKAIASGFPNCKGTYPDCPKYNSKVTKRGNSDQVRGKKTEPDICGKRTDRNLKRQ